MDKINKRLVSLDVLSVDDVISIGFTDKNGISICVGDICKTYDSSGNEWIGLIEKVNADKITKSQCWPVYCFNSDSKTWINNQDCASELVIVERNGKLL